MLQAIHHRGPDDQGQWADMTAGIVLGQKRLSILDLSQGGHQPMKDISGRYVIVFNGEIYNHKELWQALNNERISRVSARRGHSDTEILLECIPSWGLRHTSKACLGMFALALWDREKTTLSIARDRMREKPLYYGWQGSIFLFASELKALSKHPAFADIMNQEVIPSFMHRGCIKGPATICK